MTRYERRLYSFGVVIAAILIIAIVAVLTEGCGAETAVYAAPMCAVENFTEETAKETEIGQIRDSAMPCDDPDAFAKWLETYEAETAPEIQIYRIAGELIDPDIQRTIYKALEAENLTDWYTGALAQCFQESRGDRFAVSKNGLDMGIFQYREPFWNYYSNGDIFDPEAQAKLYAKEMARRFSSGLSVDEAISRHYTSDYHTEVDWEYVGQVKQWLNQMKVVK